MTTECDEVAANMDLTGFATAGQCRAKVREMMGDETTQVVDNVAEALWGRYVATWPQELWIKRILEVTSSSKLGCILRSILRDPRDYTPRFSYGAIITSDGYIMCGFTNGDGIYHPGAFLGSRRDLVRNLVGLCAFLHLSEPEIFELSAAVDRWVTKDYSAVGIKDCFAVAMASKGETV